MTYECLNFPYCTGAWLVRRTHGKGFSLIGIPKYLFSFRNRILNKLGGLLTQGCGMYLLTNNIYFYVSGVGELFELCCAYVISGI